MRNLILGYITKTETHRVVPSGKHVRDTYTPLNLILYRKTGVCRSIASFLFLIQNIDCGYPLEPPQRGGSNEYPQSVF